MKFFARHPRLRRVLIWGTGALLVLALLLAASVWFLLGTQGGTELLFTRLGAILPGSLEVRELRGPLRGPLTIDGLVYERDGMEVHVDHLELQWRLRDLLARQLDIQRLHARGVRIIPAPSEEEEPKPLPDVNLRFNILVRDALVEDLRIGDPQEDPLVIDRIELSTTAIGNVFRIDHFVVRSPLVSGDISGTFQPQGDYPVDLELEWRVRPPDMAEFAGRGSLTGTLEQLRVAQSLSAPFPAQVNATLRQPLRDLQFDGRLVSPGFNPQAIQPDFPDLPARGEVTFQGEVEAFTSTGTIRGELEQAGGPVAVSYRLTREGERWNIQRAEIQLPGEPTRIIAEGQLTSRGEELDFTAEAAWQDLRWPLRRAEGEPLVASPRGNIELTGGLDGYRAQLEALISEAPGGEALPGRWVVTGEGNRERFRIDELSGALLGGSVAGRGEVAWEPQVRWNALLRGTGIDPESLAPDFPGNLSFAATTRGRLEEAGPAGTVELSGIEGTLRGEPLAGTAALRLAGDIQELTRLDLDWGTANLEASGRLAPAYDLTWSLAAPDLGLAVPQAGGSLVARGTVQGPTEAPQVEATAQGRELRFGETRVATADLAATVSFAEAGPLSIDLEATGVQSGEQRVSELSVEGSGTRQDHTLRASATAEQGRVDLALAGGLTGTTAWSGQIRQLDLRAEETGNWRLQDPAALTASAEAVSVRDFCWLSGEARLCAEGGWSQEGPWTVDATVASLPLSRFEGFFPPDLEITGDIDGSIEASGTGSALTTADVDLRPGPGRISFPGQDGRTVTFPYEQATLQAQAAPGGTGRATANLVLTGVGTMSARLALPRFEGQQPLTEQPLSGRVEVDVNDLSFVEGFIAELSGVRGSLTGAYDLSGTFGQPRFVGQAQLANGQADLPRLGIELREVRLAATGNGSGALTLDGSARSGPGTLTIRGTAGVPGPDTPVRLTIQGQRFQVSDTEEISALITPDLTFTLEGDQATLTGEVRVPQAEIEIAEREEGPVAASEDVVFVSDREEEEEAGDGLALTARVRVILGGDVEVSVFGLNAEPTGSLLLVQRPGQETRATGELEVEDGTFKAYGQDLTIERGRLIFAGPVDNPGIDLRAFRKANDGTVAGIEARGTLEEPEVSLWSDPPMTQTEQLSYLLLGRPLDRAQPEEGDQLARAATALGLRGGNLLAKRLGARFGLEEARIESGETLDEASLVLGKYLSPDLYVSFGIGLFEPVNTFRIRYLLSDKWTLQAETGAGTSADVLYTVER